MDKIKNFLRRIAKSRVTPYVIILIVGLIIMIPLLSTMIASFNEFRIHIVRVVKTKLLLENGTFPPLISSEMMNGFGYAINVFYGPFTTYLPILFSYLCGSSINGLKVFTIVSVILSGFTMYNFAYEISKKRGAALISAIVYMLAPYKLTDIYARNAVGEYAAFIFIPMIFEGLYNLLKGNKKKDYLLIIGAIGLVLTHTISTIYVALFAVLYLLINIKCLKDYKVWKTIAISVIFIIAITSFYLVPLLEFKSNGDYAIYNQNYMGSSSEAVYRETMNIGDFFKVETGSEELLFSIGIVIIFLVLLGGKKLFKYNAIDEGYRKEYITFLLFSIISLIMCTKLFPWRVMPGVMTIIQFAWRMNGFFITFIAIICGINAYEFIKDFKYRYIFYLVIIVVSLILGLVRINNFLSASDQSTIDSKYEEWLIDNKKMSPYNVNREYLPSKAFIDVGYVADRQDNMIIIEGSGIVNDNMVKVLSNDVEIELPYLYYPGYEVRQNGNLIDYNESDHGFISIKVSEDSTIEVEYVGTKIEKISYIVSAAGLCIYLVYMIYRIKNNKKE